MTVRGFTEALGILEELVKTLRDLDLIRFSSGSQSLTLPDFHNFFSSKNREGAKFFKNFKNTPMKTQLETELLYAFSSYMRRHKRADVGNYNSFIAKNSLVDHIIRRRRLVPFFYVLIFRFKPTKAICCCAATFSCRLNLILCL